MANDTPENREKNRRVEFNITKQELTAEAGTETSKEKVVGKSSKNEEN